MGIKWIRENPGAARDEGSYYHSVERRFEIAPNFRSTIYPSHYTLTDRLENRDYFCDTIREAKDRAARIVD